MAITTSVSINIITGHTNVAHVSSRDDAAIWRGLVGDKDNPVGANGVVLSDGNQLSLTENSAGSLTISDGVFCIAGGHMGRIADTATVEYELPTENNYGRVVVVIRYAEVSTVESMTLMTLRSDTQQDVSPTASTSAAIQQAINAAKALTVDIDDETDYLLYDFVCSQDGIVSGTLKTVFTTVDNIPMLREDVGSATQRITTAENNVSGLRYDLTAMSQVVSQKANLVKLYDTPISTPWYRFRLNIPNANKYLLFIHTETSYTARYGDTSGYQSLYLSFVVPPSENSVHKCFTTINPNDNQAIKVVINTTSDYVDVVEMDSRNIFNGEIQVWGITVPD